MSWPSGDFVEVVAQIIVFISQFILVDGLRFRVPSVFRPTALANAIFRSSIRTISPAAAVTLRFIAGRSGVVRMLFANDCRIFSMNSTGFSIGMGFAIVMGYAARAGAFTFTGLASPPTTTPAATAARTRLFAIAFAATAIAVIPISFIANHFTEFSGWIEVVVEFFAERAKFIN